MALLTASQSADLRRAVQGDGGPLLDTPKPTLDAAFQNIEDWFEANRAALGAAITGGFTAPQKLRLVKAWLLQKFQRGG
jgi:hypothetical protein